MTILTSLKKNVGRVEEIQRAAMANWLECFCGAEIVDVGEGRDFSQVGGGRSEVESGGGVCAWFNADILFARDEVVRLCAWMDAAREDFLIVGRRTDLLPGGQREVHRPSGMDYFFFRAGVFRDLPPTIMGRAYCDSALLAHCLRKGIRVIDASAVLTVTHQWHDYAHAAGGRAEVFGGEAAQANKRNNRLRDFGPHVADVRWKFERVEKVERVEGVERVEKGEEGEGGEKGERGEKGESGERVREGLKVVRKRVPLLRRLGLWGLWNRVTRGGIGFWGIHEYVGTNGGRYFMRSGIAWWSPNSNVVWKFNHLNEWEAGIYTGFDFPCMWRGWREKKRTGENWTLYLWDPPALGHRDRFPPLRWAIDFVWRWFARRCDRLVLNIHPGLLGEMGIRVEKKLKLRVEVEGVEGGEKVGGLDGLEGWRVERLDAEVQRRRAEEKVAEWLAGVDEKSFDAALEKLLAEKCAAGEYRFNQPEEQGLALAGAKRFYREFSRKIVPLSDGRYVYFAPDARAKIRNGSNAISWAEYAFHAVSNGGVKIPGKNYNERWYNPYKVATFEMMDAVLKQEHCFIRLSSVGHRYDAIVFAGDETTSAKLQIVTRLDEMGNIDANLSEVTFTASSKEKKLPRFVPLARAVRTVVHYQTTAGSNPPNGDSLANRATVRKGGEKVEKVEDVERVEGVSVVRDGVGARMVRGVRGGEMVGVGGKRIPVEFRMQDAFDGMVMGEDGEGVSVVRDGEREFEYDFGVLSNWTKAKGGQLMAKAMAKMPGKRCLWIGDCKVENRSCISTFTFTGRLPQAEAFEKLKTCRVLVAPYLNVPSLKWNYVLKIFEYLQLGRPIVASDNPGNAAVAKRFPGRIALFKSGDAEDLVLKLSSVENASR